MAIDLDGLGSEKVAHGVEGVGAHIGDGTGPEAVLRAVVLAGDLLGEAGVEEADLADGSVADFLDGVEGTGLVVQAVGDHEPSRRTSRLRR